MSLDVEAGKYPPIFSANLDYYALQMYSNDLENGFFINSVKHGVLMKVPDSIIQRIRSMSDLKLEQRIHMP